MSIIPFENASISIFSDPSIKDYPVECEINQSTSFPILNKFCPCGQMLGYYQRLIESKIGNMLEKSEKSPEDRNDILSEARIKMTSFS